MFMTAKMQKMIEWFKREGEVQVRPVASIEGEVFFGRKEGGHVLLVTPKEAKSSGGRPFAAVHVHYKDGEEDYYLLRLSKRSRPIEVAAMPIKVSFRAASGTDGQSVKYL